MWVVCPRKNSRIVEILFQYSGRLRISSQRGGPLGNPRGCQNTSASLRLLWPTQTLLSASAALGSDHVSTKSRRLRLDSRTPLLTAGIILVGRGCNYTIYCWVDLERPHD